MEARAFYAIPITDMLIFSTLIYFAFRQRFNPSAHKRLILIATITLLDAAFGRWPIPVAWWDLRVAQMCCYALLLLLIGYDLWSTRKVQSAAVFASLFLIVLQRWRVQSGNPYRGRVSPLTCRILPVRFPERPRQLARSASSLIWALASRGGTRNCEASVLTVGYRPRGLALACSH